MISTYKFRSGLKRFLADRPVHLNIAADQPQNVESHISYPGRFRCNFQNNMFIGMSALLLIHTIFVAVIMGFGAKAIERFL